MLKKLKNSFLVLVLALSMIGCVDQSGKSDNNNLTIAATSVAVTEILEALDVPADQVIGIPTTESYTIPKKYKRATELGTAMSPDIEVLSTLKPSLVLSPNSLEGDLASKYEKIGVSSSFLNLKSVAGMFKSIEELGSLLGKEKKANKLVDEFVNYMVEFRAKYQNTASPRVLILMGLPGGSYLVATESSYVGDLVKLAGGTNVYDNSDGQDFVNVNAEDMLQQNPDIILRTSHAMSEEVMKNFETEFAQNDIWSKFSAVQNGKVYNLDNKHPRIFIIFLILVLFICFFIAINLGSIQVSIVQLFKGLFIEYDVDVASVYSIRFPRIIISMLVGGALALSGLLFQVVLKNPLADPGIIGIANGASLVSVLVGLFLPQLSAIAPLLSFFGGLITFVIIYSLSWKAGFKTTRIILIGVAINYTISALVTLANSATASITSGATGTISLYTWQDVTTLLIYLVPVIIITLFMAKACNLLGLEDRILTSLGVNVNVYRFGLSLLAVLLCSISVAVVGVIAFIGLLVPHISRLLVGTEHKHLIPISILIGAIVLLVADTVGRIIMAPYEISAAIIMAIIGGPLFIILLKRSIDVDGS